MTWTRPYVKESWPKTLDDAARDRRVVEALISLHRMRGERFIEGRRFYIIRNPFEDTEDTIAVAIGFADAPTEILLDPRKSRRIPDELVAIVRDVIGI